MFRGDICDFTLLLPPGEKGHAWLRTNLGHAKSARREAIDEVLNNRTMLGRDWFDIPMRQTGERQFKVTLPVCEVGHFEAKCFFLREGAADPVWPNGPNTVINVEPAYTCCANIVYNVFVRQFGSGKHGDTGRPFEKNYVRKLDECGYTVIPKSGTFRDLVSELDFIIKDLGCRIIQLLPIHPTPTTYARMGRFGSPYAALNFTSVDPALAQFDPRATPMEQFLELVDAIHQRSAKIFLDIAINHTGWGARLHETNPQWLARDKDGQIEVPGAWGVMWEDLTKLDYTHKGLWEYMADVFLTWCRRGVDGFRCDAGYMIPEAAWRFIVAIVRDQYPDTVFLLEGLGGKISVTRAILNRANFNWAYSELFQNYDRNQIENYLPEMLDISSNDGIMVHFAETHDNNRLAARSKKYAMMRTGLCALCSQNGGFGFANGVEWFAVDKIDVHRSPSLNWGAKTNQVEYIRCLTKLLKNHPAFHEKTVLKLAQKKSGNCIVLARHNLPSGKRVLALVNLDDKNKTQCHWDQKHAGIYGHVFTDLITKEKVAVDQSDDQSGDQSSLILKPGQVLCLTADKKDLDLVYGLEHKNRKIPYQKTIDKADKQQLKAKALDVFVFYNGSYIEAKPGGKVFDPDKAALSLWDNPFKYCQELNRFSKEARVIKWRWPEDVSREVMVPPMHFLLVYADSLFNAQIIDKENGETLACENCLPCNDNSFFALFSPLTPKDNHCSCILRLSVYAPSDCKHMDANLVFLSKPENACVERFFRRSALFSHPLLFLGTNGRGGMLRAHVSWGKLESKYDALLAANLNPNFPDDRWIMLTRCRLWAVFQDYSQKIGDDCFDSFFIDNNSCGFWRFRFPVGQGEHVVLFIALGMIQKENAIKMVFFRMPLKGEEGELSDEKKIRLILRPDIEDRNFHHTTKAYTGAEHTWPDCVKKYAKGFTFTPVSDRKLSIKISKGNYVPEPEWQYMVHRPMEVERGLDPDSDLFSPGYFTFFLGGGESVELSAWASSANEQQHRDMERLSMNIKMPERWGPYIKDFAKNNIYTGTTDNTLIKAMEQFVVKRGDLSTVIAGYPWFLDWGRDTLIFVRGLIAAGEIKTAKDILIQFGEFEIEGTLPNMIRGSDSANRETSDGPLWYFVACSDIVDFEKDSTFLNTKFSNRTILKVLNSIGQSLIKGTSNNVKMDPESGLIFSPAHFTWMDTNHPAGTPRQGYPIEIQAMWHHALSFLSRIDPTQKRKMWHELATKVGESILDLFMIERKRYLADCLHADFGQPAKEARPDDALRPNQLFAVTLGAVKDRSVCRDIVTACEELLVPGAIRTLADREVAYPIEVIHHNRVINDPYHPYQGRYEGDEDTKRKPAYHNGTAWTWVFPSFSEAWAIAYGDKGIDKALALLSSSTRLINDGCIGHLPEIVDGNFPHKQRGCDAQAWGVSEFFRVWKGIKDRLEGLN